MKSSGIGGQAVIEGVMMRHKTDIAVAVRRNDGSIVIGRQKAADWRSAHKVLGWPIIRGVVSFISSLIIGIRTLMFSASFFEEESEKIPDNPKKEETEIKNENQGGMMFITLGISLVFAIAIFMVLPYYASGGLMKLFGSESPTLLAVIEGVLKLLIFIGYIAAISGMKDIRRTFMYHGAEHKCINCIEGGHELNVDNVMASSRQHRRCGTSFIFFVLFISIIFFIFLRFDSRMLRIVVRLLLVPVIAGVSYEFIQWAGNSDLKIAGILSKPGLWIQGLTTREPDREMAEVAIASVEAVFDWKNYLRGNGYEIAEPHTTEAGADDSLGNV